MGAFFTSVQVHTGGHPAETIRDKILEAVRSWILGTGYEEVASDAPSADRHVVIGPAQSPWIGVYDELTETQHIDLLVQLAGIVSKATRTPTLTVLVHDSDVLELRLCQDGSLIDSYSSEPDYFERVGAKRRRELAGNPELWAILRPSGSSPQRLREAMRKKGVFAEDTLRAIAEVLELQAEQCLAGYNSLAQGTLAAAPYTRLAFRTKAQVAAERLQPSGPPRLVFAGHPGVVQFGVGDYVENMLHLHLHNKGGASRGFDVRVAGGGLSLFTPTVAVAWKGMGQQLVEAPFTHAGPAPGEGLAARFPEFELPATISSPEFPDLTGDPAAVAQAIRAHDHILEAQVGTTILVDIRGRGTSSGSEILQVQVAPLEAPVGAAEQNVRLHVSQPAHRPLRSIVGRPSVTLDLQAMETPRVLFALGILERSREDCSDAAARAVERWLQVISPSTKEAWQVVTQELGDDEIREKKIRADAIPQGKRWRDLMNRLGQHGLVAGYLGYVPFSRGSGFYWKTDSIFLKPPSDSPAPHLGLWCEVGERGDDNVEHLISGLVDIVDELTLRVGMLQSFLARWDWSPNNMDSTPYERACDIHGQVTMGRSWCARFLRGVADRMWLGPTLLEKIDIEALKATAVVLPVGRGIRLTLKPGSSLTDLERVLASVLPGADDWKVASGLP